jgi:hypothetical protein
MFIKRNGTSLLSIDHALYLYFLGLSTRSVSKAIFHLHNVKRSHVLLAKIIKVDSEMSFKKDILTREKED